MRIRTLDEPLQTPPPGAVTLGIARHLTESYPDPQVIVYHRDRAGLIHGLADSLSLQVLDWGTTDHENPPNEIVEIVVPITVALISAGASIIAAWMGRPREGDEDQAKVLGVALRRPDGTQIQFDYRTAKDLKMVAGEIRNLLEPAMQAGEAGG